MSKLIADAFEEKLQAETVRLELLKMQSDYLITVEDIVIASKNEKGKVKLQQPVNLTAAGAVNGGFWGVLIGMLFFAPLLGAAVGASAGALSGTLTDIGIDDQFMKQSAKELKPGGALLFVLIKDATTDKVLERLNGMGGKLLSTSLSHEAEEKIQAALNG